MLSTGTEEQRRRRDSRGALSYWCLAKDGWIARRLTLPKVICDRRSARAIYLRIIYVCKNYDAQSTLWDHNYIHMMNKTGRGLSIAEPRRWAGQIMIHACHDDGHTMNDRGDVTRKNGPWQFQTSAQNTVIDIPQYQRQQTWKYVSKVIYITAPKSRKNAGGHHESLWTSEYR